MAQLDWLLGAQMSLWQLVTMRSARFISPCMPYAVINTRLVNEQSVLDGMEHWCISLDDGDSAGKSAISSLLPSKKNE
jgi:hypothetical protein